MIVPNALAAYRAAAVRLRETAEWNRFDASFQRRGAGAARLIPLVDANIVKFFMDPDHGIRLVDSFANLTESLSERKENGETETNPTPPEHLVTFARVTAEFMFLSATVSIGNEERRLWQEAPLIAPAHAEETASMLRQIERKISELYKQVAQMTEAQVLGADGRRAVQTVEALSAGGADPEAFKGLVRDVTRSFAELFVPKAMQKEAAERTSALEEGSRWLRLMRDTKLRPLLSHSLCDADVLHPPAEKVRRLAEKLVVQKKRAALARGESSTRVSQLAWQDATVVVQTTMLNELARQRQADNGQEIRFILISGDDTLHTVYADQFWSDPNARPEDYVLRRPLQYIPIMNARDIPNGYQAQELFDTFLAVLNTVTDFVTQRRHKAFALDYDWRHGSYKRSPWRTELEMSALRELAELWLEATIASNALCAGLAVHDFGIKDLVARLDEFAGDKKALAPLIDLHEKIYRDIDGVQLPLIAQELLAEAVGALRRQAKAKAVGGVRIPLLVRERFEDVTTGLPLDKFIASLAEDQAGMVQLQQSMQRWSRPKVLFFAGAVAAAANNFERAARHLAHASQLLHSGASTSSKAHQGQPGDLAEVSYLQCVVDRLRMRDRLVFNDARHRLERLVETAPKGSFEQVRAASEAGSLFLMRYFNVTFGIEEGANPPDAAAMMTRSKAYLDEARRGSLSVRERRMVELSLINELDEQIHTNTIGWHIVQSGFFEGRESQLQEAVKTSLDILENVGGNSHEQDHIIGFWEHVALWLMAPPAQRAERAAEVAEFCTSRLSELKRLGAEYQAPTDAVVFSFVAERASGEAAR